MNNGTTPVDVVKVEDGAMVWQEKKGGTPYWKNTELSNFVARVDFQAFRPVATTASPFAIPAPATRPTSACANCRCSTTITR